ncbi:hypothetical protein KDW54_06735 [Burkholderia ambifaria]|uniref:hypothetical protein n=1 Tax=Burkholderia ambifaria TaxID=152480 RepID=UPI001B929114|nr:hypothetical protein [Burkholderia ambifaria]MBR8182094.1 hypothetical protein [Burkholderia ambifaria]
MQLRVIEPFGSHKPGDLIADVKAVKAVLESEQSQYVVKVADPPTPIADDK